MKMKSIKKQILFGLPILAALSALPRVAQAQEEIRFDGEVSLKTIEAAQVACAKEAIAPIWKAAFGRDLGKGARVKAEQSARPDNTGFTMDIFDGGNHLWWDITDNLNRPLGSRLYVHVVSEKSSKSEVALLADAFPFITFEVLDGSHVDVLGNFVKEYLSVQNLRILSGKPMTGKASLTNTRSDRQAAISIDTARYVSCLSSYFRQ